jgi:two-component sensor histidine kinase
MKGIVRFDPASRSFRNYTIQDGLETESVIHSNAQTTDGTIFFPTIQNVIAVNPGAILPEKPTVSPGFIHLKIGEKEKYMANWSTPVALAAHENNFSIEFSSMNMITPGSDEFQYLLEGYDKTWISAGNRRFANYTNLPGGHYLFKLRCRNSTPQWSEPTVLNFHVATIFYKTWWFLSLVVLLMGTIVYLFYRMKLSRLMAINNMRQRFSRDLHDDIGSTLSSINILTRTGGGQNGEDVIFTLKKIQERSQKMLDAMDDIIWSAKPENDPMESLVIRMREYAGEVLEAAGIDYSIEIPDAMKDIKLNMEQKKNLYLVFKEAINNLAKYSKSKEANIRFQMNHSLLKMVVHDSGVGFDPSLLSRGNGLENMKARTAEMNGNLVIDTSFGKGTTVKVELPL